MSHNDLVAAFWRPLKERVDRSGVGLKSLGRAVGLSPPALSETLNGRRAKAPDLDLVLAIARACDEDRVDFWRHRLDELVSELERAGPAPGAVARRERGGTTEAEARPGCPGCQDAYEGDRFAEYDWAVEDEWEPSHFLGAARVLAGEHADLRHEAQALVEGVLGVPAHVTAFRDQFTDLTDRLLAGLGRRVRRSCHGHRVRLLHAAHTVVVIEGGVGGPIIDLSHDMPGTSRREVEVARLLRDSFGDGTFASAPLPVAGTHYADHRTRVQQHYAEAALETRGEALPAAAVEECAARYEGRLLDLAAECPELFVWASLQDGPTAAKALRARPAGPGRARLEALYRQLHDQKTGLDGLESLLCALARDITPGIWPARLSAVYRRELSRPISPVGEAGDNLPGPTIPRLARGYVNPAFRTAVHTHDSRPHSDAWWNTRPLRQEIQGFLAGHLSAFPVVGRPLVVLGDPGSGKSLLTRLLAARLPPTDYLPIRIELRNVIADSEIDEQIAYALHQATQKTLTWETVTGTNDRVLPVLIFDGFDELLQAGGTGHWGYLEEIAEFQRTSADNGCPVAAIVTSRTVVADQTHFPDGTVIIRLEPFDAPRVARWTGAWNTTNRRLGRPLRGDLARLHPELAPQPLLLLMLALYHSVDPGPGDDAVPMSRVSLYERLLGLFVRRQIRKLEPRLPPEALEEKVEDELDLLSVIACAMFNRGRQGVSAEEADHDLRYLRAPDRGTDHSEARLLFGRFFFIHESRATYQDGADRRWYEFLHATFGEYLVARKIARTLRHCPDQGVHEGLLFALLSFAPLTDRRQIIENLGELLPRTAPVPVLFRRALDAVPASADTGYGTGPVPVTYRHACHSANLLLLALASRGIVRFSELITDADAPDHPADAQESPDADPAAAWRCHAMLWKSQFTEGSWDAFTLAVGTVPVQAPVRDVVVHLHHHDAPVTAVNMSWHSGADAASGPIVLGPADEVLRRSRPLHDLDTERLLEPALPVFEELGRLTSLLARDGVGRHVSVAHTLIALLLCPPDDREQLRERYELCLDGLTGAIAGADKGRLVALLSGRLVNDGPLLPAAFVLRAIQTLIRAAADAEALSAATRISLLMCVVRLLTRTHLDAPTGLVRELLEMGPQYGGVPRAGSPESLLDAAFRVLREGPLGRARDRSVVWLLKLSVALDLRGWSDRHGGWLLDELGPEARAMLAPEDFEYLRNTFSLRDRNPDLRADGWGRHP